MASQLINKEERERLSGLFKAFDKNSDGKLDKKELREGYEKHMSIVLCDEEVDEIFDRIDIDSSGYIDYSEFVAAAMDI
jgi:calcium-dependent protein kinase